MTRVSLPFVSAAVPRSLAAGVLAGLPVVAVYLWRGFSLASFGEEPGLTLLRQGYMVVGAFAVAGVPAALSVRYGLVSPAVLAGLLLVPTLLERNAPETPAFGLLLLFWPVCLVLYATVGSVEYGLRRTSLFG